MFNSAQIDKAFDQFKNVAGNSIFDQVTGTIKTTIENSGIKIEAPNQVKPVASQVSEQNEAARMNFDYTPYLIGAALIGAFLIFKSKKGRVS